MNLVFANQDDEEAIYPLTTWEISEAQKHDNKLNNMTDEHGYMTQLVENTKVLCKNGKMVIPKSLQQRAVAWYHHYLQHPGNTRLEKLFVSRCIGKVSERQSNHMSKNVIVVR